jgi:hypothetical protein
MKIELEERWRSPILTRAGWDHVSVRVVVSRVFAVRGVEGPRRDGLTSWDFIVGLEWLLESLPECYAWVVAQLLKQR